jgi:collagenase-like PrtC family protease
MPYELINDGKEVDLGNCKYLLSPQDLAGLEVLPDLVKAGVSCLKIEGRPQNARIRCQCDPCVSPSTGSGDDGVSRR